MRFIAKLKLISVIVCAVIIAVSCTITDSEQASQLVPISPEPQASSLCETIIVFEQCSAINFTSGNARYALLRTGQPTKSTVFIDFGGPGISTLSGNYKLAQVHSLLQAYGINANLLVIEEPWVTKKLNPECEMALSFFAANLQVKHSFSLANTLSLCGLDDSEYIWRYGITPNGLTSAINAIIEKENIEIKYIIGISFGSVRALYLNDSLGSVPTYLINPYPIGIPLQNVLEYRAALLESWIENAGYSKSDFADIQIASAAIAASYGGKKSFLEFIQQAKQGTLSENRLDRLFRSTWFLYGDAMISPAYLAYLEEACKFGAIPDIVPMIESPIRNVMSRFHAPCPDNNLPQISNLDSMTVDCVIANQEDPIVPIYLIEQSFKQTITTNIDPSVPHAWIDSLTDCFNSDALQ